MPREEKKLAMSAVIQIKAAAAPAEGETAPTRASFTIDAYSGDPINCGFYAPIIVDLTGLKAGRAKLPILLDHENSVECVFGQTDKIEITAAGVKVTGTVTSDSDEAAQVVANAKNGFEWQASIGASIDVREILESGAKATVNGREISGPVIIARKATLKEISICAIGADPTAQTQIENSSIRQRRAWLARKFHFKCGASKAIASSVH